jgi:outer membrane protein TolC
VVEAVALRQLAAAQLLPSLHAGISYDDHNGNLQTANGTILKVDRSSLYFGAGAAAVGAGSVTIPGVFWSGNVAEGIFTALVARQEVEVRTFASQAIENDMLLRTAVTFNELLRAEGLTAVARQTLVDAQEVAKLAITFAKAGAGRQPDADRALSEQEQRAAEIPEAEGSALIASARLAELLNMPPTTRFTPLDDKMIPCALVSASIPLPELLALAVLNRPELKQRQASIRQALLTLEGTQTVPFSPTVLIGLSYGEQGGGSDLVAQPLKTNAYAEDVSRFGSFAERLDFEVVMYWSAENLALGNCVRIALARSRLGITQLQFLEMLNLVRTQVATAYARSLARFAQITTAELAMRSAMDAFAADLRATRGGEGRPIELLFSLRYLARARIAYLNAIADYNRAQVELFVALGQPPANALARSVPGEVPAVPRDAKDKKN